MAQLRWRIPHPTTKSLDYDIRVVVIGDKLGYWSRGIRKDDFRASGSGSVSYDKNLVSPALINTAFEAASALDTDCMGFDIIYDPKTHDPLIIEMSYGFPHATLLESGGYYDKEGTWHNSPLNAPVAILKRLLNKAEKQKLSANQVKLTS
ncbi:hypothetical protein P1P91_00170 [Halomonas piscis]|uniref:ATP-grasp domain-containing protein n=1 Tax=Halomonas piscis TaxID=3031727 RepID=A0ABY9Z0F0_9GAMM|nr:hypothetical protein [Halomonas piscis]WNK20151.1 hypothetical protein P1P91_00170 [Halomonas piscis]